MRAAARFVFIAAAWFALLAVPVFAAPAFPPLTGRVVDDAGILSQGARDELTSMLAQQEKQTGVQVVVVTLKSLQGYEIEDYGYQLGRHWGIGQKGKDNGALLIIAPKEHKVRIEVGYGLEGKLTDAQSKIIIDQIVIPAFKSGDFDGGVIAGTTAILKVIGGATINPQQYAQPDGSSDANYGVGAGPHIPIFLIVFVLWVVFGRFFWPLFLLGGLGGGFGGYGGGRGGFGGGFGGGGFSGGGGSFGGGGASGGW